ncbi:MAG: hypothetical protein IPJ84_05570 [Bdellovibrionales bacterium]|nr:hypothetical protein [Bdellovibrionales bacterium]
MKKIFFYLAILFAQFSYACPVGKVGLSADALKNLKRSSTKWTKAKRTISNESSVDLPTAQSEQPWGGKDTKNWRPEAILANAASLWLNQGWKSPDIADVLVSVPVKMIFTNERVYGDGQTNASLHFGDGWKTNHPQLIATLLKFKSGSRKVIFSFSTSVKIGTAKFKLTYFREDPSGNSTRKDETFEIKNQQAEWNVPTDTRFGDLEKSRLIWIRPQGWDSSFPIDFRMDIRTNKTLVGNAGNARTAGRNPMDPLAVFSESKKTGQHAQTILLNSAFGPEWVKNDKGTNELRNESIHGEIHVDGKEVKTGVGGGLTWLVDRGAGSTFKNLYTCFDPRNFNEESKMGVPSGGGWHEIGDAAETIINDLEIGAVPVGFATGLPWATPPDQTKFPWGLSDVVTLRLLMPGEAVVTPAGDRTWEEDRPAREVSEFHPDWSKSKRGTDQSGGGRNYHWFFFPTNEPTCTQEWVHHCRPTEANNLGLKCP